MSETSKTDLALVAKAEKIAATMLKGREWTDWLVIGEAMEIGRKIAMERSGAEAREGKGYCQAFSDWLDEKGHENLRRVTSPAMSALDKCWQNREAIAKWREILTDDQRLQWNYPPTVWSHFAKANIVPEQEPEDDESKDESQETTAEDDTGESETKSSKREMKAATVEFVEWAVNAIEEDRLAVPTIISWLEEMDVKEAIEALREYAATHVEEDTY